MAPKWRSEIDDFPATVAGHHFPDVPNLGDITKIKAEDLEPVDIICAGSPCQDLSVAGKRAGLEGERSGLFRTAIRLVHELRRRTGKPRYFVWENVPGAFSSNKGHDFRAVLEEISQTAIPMPGSGKWANAGVVSWGYGSLAWRVLDAQYWGVPQRRKRIFLVADFAGQSAGEILFEPASLHGHIAESERKGEVTATDAGTGTESTGWDAYQHHNWRYADKLGPLTTGSCDRVRGDTPLVSAGFKYRNGAKARSIGYANGQAPTLDTSQNVAIYDLTHHDEVVREIHGNKTQTLKARAGTGGNNTPIVQCLNGQGGSVMDVSDKAGTLRAQSHGHEPIVHTICGNIIGRENQNGGHQLGVGQDVSYTLNTVDRHAVAVGYRAGQYGQYVQDDKAGSARASGGDLGGGSESLIIEK